MAAGQSGRRLNRWTLEGDVFSGHNLFKVKDGSLAGREDGARRHFWNGAESTMPASSAEARPFAFSIRFTI
jgi:hypothetical protein